MGQILHGPAASSPLPASWSIGDWRSSDGRKKSRAESYCPVWVFEDQAFNRNITYKKDPVELGNKLKINRGL
jgi:hypothetical protein